MRWIASLVAAVALVAATACQATGYAVVSLIGSELTFVGAQPVSSTNLDRNDYSTVPVKDDTLDRAVFNAVDHAVVARSAQNTALLLRRPVADVRAAFADDRKSKAAVAKVVAAIRPTADKAGLDRLVLVAPYRFAPMMATADGHVGSGRVAGLGIYVDRMTRLDRQQAGDAYPGYLGLFANFRVFVVDVHDGRVLGDDVVTSGTTYAVARSPTRDPMKVIPAEEKLRELQGLVDREIARVLPPLLVKADP